MNILLSRIDERLIHGQIMTRWITGLSIVRILLADDKIAGDAFMTEVLTLSAPVGVTVEVLGAADAAERIASDASGEKTLLLFQDIRSVKALADAGYLPPRLNIGNIGSSPVRKAVTREVFLSPEEIGMARELIGRGADIYIQKLPTDRERNLASLLEKKKN